MFSSSQALRVQRVVVQQRKRALHDLVSLPGRKPIVSYGTPGYSAVSGHVVTVFGCTGFLGRYLVSQLGELKFSFSRELEMVIFCVTAKMGTQVVVPYREEDEKRHLKPMGDLGQIVPLEWDLRNENQIAECLRHSDIVYNLVGRDYETKNFDYSSVHVDGAERIAKIAAEVGVQRLVHVSHLNASSNSSSQYYRTKAEGEERVRKVFPSATIVRPASLFGYEDKFLNNMAIWPIWWKLNYGETRIRPVHVMDVAQALANLMSIPQLSGTLNLPGPNALTFEYLLDLVSSVTYGPPSRAPVVPKRIALLIAKAAQAAWWPILSPDEVERRYIDDTDVPGDWAAVGVTPEEIENLAITYLRRYRSAENFVRPVVFPARSGQTAP
ncbi:39kDa subunit of Ndufa9, NADH ubiquinone oxidoreductase [Serpula lacrymans var. lacrymans S7.3]|uniref:39kDa subunit of Ndufa9, NADH ubiquinone oxidoreductase n=2 Tax=Serpula lacrymans var. lacrymans TaxID=341189 RepID=F8QHT9_SERL3|nr:39kDa subunit of NDUFA9, NADH:ubiquinone oxidoreductase [Serpula lacrymans var. lacrymans S7.9]EGN92135.1 39kDa subunit of Ndufa9, NADH ubiquinone oxidoreductase [Serpula lacrymans var. lacrymans S7.3]EGO23989.1 39kDa subunit of NDUFA9, NADH:ubiquinone oxidoreductase [Serpula lacrymans var. lacrymans S7.9]